MTLIKISVKFGALCAFLVLAVTVTAERHGKTEDQDVAFGNFLKSTMKNYGVWLRANTFDLGSYNFSSSGRNANFSIVTSNLRMTGHDNVDISSGSGKLFDGKMSVGYSTLRKGLIISGDYDLEGNLFSSSVPVSGQGTFTLQIGNVPKDYASLGYNVQLSELSFDVTPKGFVSLDENSGWSSFYEHGASSLALSDVSAGGYEALVEKKILADFLSHFNAFGTRNIFHAMLIQYLSQVFDKAPYLENLDYIDIDIAPSS